jgi:beta-galactosidase
MRITFIRLTGIFAATGKRVSARGVNIIFSGTNTHHRGEENYRRSGEVDALRIIKENYYAHKVMWNGCPQ